MARGQSGVGHGGSAYGRPPPLPPGMTPKATRKASTPHEMLLQGCIRYFFALRSAWSARGPGHAPSLHGLDARRGGQSPSLCRRGMPGRSPALNDANRASEDSALARQAGLEYLLERRRLVFAHILIAGPRPPPAETRFFATPRTDTQPPDLEVAKSRIDTRPGDRQPLHALGSGPQPTRPHRPIARVAASSVSSAAVARGISKGADTRYVRRQSTRFDLTCRVDHARLAEVARCDGVFPLITNVVAMSALEVLLAYKQQPMIEKRFSQLKTDFVVAPVFLKEVSRIQALLSGRRSMVECCLSLRHPVYHAA